MPQIFKALATINAWALFIIGWMAVIGGFVRLIKAYAGVAAPPGVPPVWMTLGAGVAGLTLSVVVMKLRKGLE